MLLQWEPCCEMQSLTGVELSYNQYRIAQGIVFDMLFMFIKINCLGVFFWRVGLALCLLSVAANAADTPNYIADTRCADCHPDEYQQWLGSHHDWAMQPATEATVSGNFDQADFTHFGVTSRFFRDGERFMVNTEGPDGAQHDYPIKYTFGVEPLQQYLVEFPGGRLQALSIAWDTRAAEQGGQRWFHLYPNERIKPGDPLHWTGSYQNWNGMCAECHSTNLQKRYDPASDSYQTHWSEVNVGCQACHGPGASHVNLASVSQGAKMYYSGLPISYKTADPAYEIDQCARCHSRRREVSPDNHIGQPLLDSYMPALLEPELYFPDGQIQDEVYVYGSFLQSRMYQAGVRCTDCHNPHTAKLKVEGNAICTQCHSPSANPRFPTLQAKLYDDPKHHFHPSDTSGAQCVNCHMPARTYMVVDPRRDHSFRIPRPDLSARLDTPNACTGCHADQNNAWAVQQLQEWYGENQREPHYGELIAAGRSGAMDNLTALTAFTGDEQQAAIVRATVLALLPLHDPAQLQTLQSAAKASEPLLRYAAIRGLSVLPPQTRFEHIVALLGDPLRAIRTEAARALNASPPSLFNEPQRAAFETALSEYRAAQEALTDIMPSAHLNLAVLDAERNRVAEAEKHYQAALALDQDFLPARFNLASLYNAAGRNKEAEQVLREGLARASDEGELYYSLGLLLAEEQRFESAVEVLGTAARLLSDRLRVHYNHGLALQHLGRAREAEQALQKAYGLDRNHPEVLQALVILHAQQQRWEQAYPYAEQLAMLYPNAPRVQQMLKEIKALRQR